MTVRLVWVPFFSVSYLRMLTGFIVPEVTNWGFVRWVLQKPSLGVLYHCVWALGVHYAKSTWWICIGTLWGCYVNFLNGWYHLTFWLCNVMTQKPTAVCILWHFGFVGCWCNVYWQWASLGISALWGYDVKLLVIGTTPHFGFARWIGKAFSQRVSLGISGMQGDASLFVFGMTLYLSFGRWWLKAYWRLPSLDIQLCEVMAWRLLEVGIIWYFEVMPQSLLAIGITYHFGFARWWCEAYWWLVSLGIRAYWLLMYLNILGLQGDDKKPTDGWQRQEVMAESLLWLLEINILALSGDSGKPTGGWYHSSFWPLQGDGAKSTSGWYHSSVWPLVLLIISLLMVGTTRHLWDDDATWHFSFERWSSKASPLVSLDIWLYKVMTESLLAVGHSAVELLWGDITRLTGQL